MADVRPFPAIRYPLETADAIGHLVCPPYDVISPEERRRLGESSPRNAVHVELPEHFPLLGKDRYATAAVIWTAWRTDGVVLADHTPGLYVYGQRYEAAGCTRERLGLIGALRVQPYEDAVVLPHEQTFPAHKEDRFRLLCATGVQLSPIFGLYAAPEAGVRDRLAQIARQEPAAASVDADGVEHRLWPVFHPEFAAWAASTFAGRQVFIADGHHRYETALRYRDHKRAEARVAARDGVRPGEYVMTFLVEMDDPGLVLLPTHRIWTGDVLTPEGVASALGSEFECVECSSEGVDDLRHHQLGIGLAGEAGPRYFRSTLRSGEALAGIGGGNAAWRNLDVVLLHHVVLPRLLPEGAALEYTRSSDEARRRLAEGSCTAVFFQPSPTVEELKQVAGAGEKMPHKSTYFWPKAITGLCFFSE